VAVGTRQTRLPNARYVGVPLRRAIATLNRDALRAQARHHWGLEADRPTLLVFGGSQGSQRLNEMTVAATADLLALGIQIVHITGPNNQQAISSLGGSRYVALSYLNQMELAYAAADLALCRAGAMTCAELTAVGMPAAYVPLPFGNGEQRLNALAVVRAGGGLVVDDAILTPSWIRDELLPLLIDPARLRTMGASAAKLGCRDAAKTLVGMIYTAVEKSAS